MSAQIVGTAPENVTALRLDHRRQRLGLEEPARHHDGRAADERGIGDAPGVRVEHRDDREHAVALGEPERGRCGRDERVQVRRAVRVRDALRVAGRARRVTHRRRLPFVELGILEAGRLRGEEIVVAQHVAVTERRRVAVTDDDEPLDGLELVDDASPARG